MAVALHHPRGGSASITVSCRDDENVRVRILVCVWRWEGPAGTLRRISTWHLVTVQLTFDGQWQVYYQPIAGKAFWRNVTRRWVGGLGIFCSDHPPDENGCDGHHQHFHPLLYTPPSQRLRRAKRLPGALRH